jgi:subtilisin family serine protease
MSAPGLAFDPRQQPLFDRLGVADAWAITRGDPGVVVGVIDSGFDFYHPDLRGQLRPGYYHPGGYHCELFEVVAHGTSIAGLIVGRGSGESPVLGLAPGCTAVAACLGTLEHKLLRLQAEFTRAHPNPDPGEWQEWMREHAGDLSPFAREWAVYQVEGVAASVRDLAGRGVRIINLSGLMLRHLCPSAEAWAKLEAAVADAAGREVLTVVGAGNDDREYADYPGDPATVLVAGACQLDGTRWRQTKDLAGMTVQQGSSYGPRLTCVAPVEDLLVLAPHDPRMYTAADGPTGPTDVPFQGPHTVTPTGATSCATAIVSALAALVISARPDLGARAVGELICRGCTPLADPHTGAGCVHFGATLRLARDADARA